MKIFYFPLEQIPQRMYSTVYQKMTKAFEKANLSYEVILPSVDASKIDTGGCVMSGAGHCQWCLEQMAIFMSKLRNGEVKEGDVCYFDDLWFPGLEAIFYATRLMNISIGVYGFIHAGSFTYLDFVYPMQHWARDLEKSWFTASDLIFVGSEQTKKDIIDTKLIAYTSGELPGYDSDKIKVTGLPFEVDKSICEVATKKEDIVIFPHRDDIDKGVDDLLTLILKVRQLYGTARYIITSGGRPVRESTKALFSSFPEVEFMPDLSKKEYYQLLSKCKVMFSAAIQENFGVCAQEALAFDVAPVCPDRVSYQYLLPTKFLYCNLNDAAAKVANFLHAPEKNLERYCHHPYSAELIVYHMLLNERK